MQTELAAATQTLSVFVNAMRHGRGGVVVPGHPNRQLLPPRSGVEKKVETMLQRPEMQLPLSKEKLGKLQRRSQRACSAQAREAQCRFHCILTRVPLGSFHHQMNRTTCRPQSVLRERAKERTSLASSDTNITVEGTARCDTQFFA
jgi:hypothetical protein